MENKDIKQTKRLLVVDDESYVTTTLANMLECLDDTYVVDTANSSSDVLIWSLKMHSLGCITKNILAK